MSTLIFRMMLVVTTAAMLGCRRAGRPVATAFVTQTTNTRMTNTNINNNNSNINNNYRATAFAARTVRLLSSRNDGYDDSGRRVRTPRPSSEWGDNDDWEKPPSSSSNTRGSDRSDSRSTSNNNDSWDDFDPWQEPKQQQQRQPERRRDDYNNNDGGGGDWNAPRAPPARRERYNDDDDNWGAPSDRPRREQRGGGRFGSSGGRGRGRGGGRGGGRGRDGDRGRGRGGRNNFQQERRGNNNRFDNNNARKSKNNEDDFASVSRSINMNSLEGAGFVHLYGLSSVLNALTTGRRDMETSMEKGDDFSEFDDEQQDDYGNDDDGDDFAAPRRRSPPKETVKPQAQFKPYLFVQERGSSGSDRRGSKASAAQEVLKLAEERDVPIAYVDKGILNVLSGNRPHQGFALRCGKLYFENLSRIPLPSSRGGDSAPSSPALWLVLDEVVDPQNLGT